MEVVGSAYRRAFAQLRSDAVPCQFYILEVFMTYYFVVDIRKLPPSVLDSFSHFKGLCGDNPEDVISLYDKILHKYLDSILEVQS